MRFIDLHCDTVEEGLLYRPGTGLYDNPGHISVPKLIEGDAFVQFFALMCPKPETAKRMGWAYKPYEMIGRCLDRYDSEMEKNRAYLAPARNVDEILKNRENGKISGILALEDGAPAEGSLEKLREFYDRGVRSLTLTWNYENCFGFPNSPDPAANARGLKPFGFEAIRCMNEWGILADVSHLSDGGFWDVVRCAEKPFIATHSCARALCPHPRNLTDEMLKALGDKGGVVGVNFYACFLNEGSKYTRIADIVRHADYMRNKAGIDAIALGSDFDGIDCELEFRDYTGMPRIAEALSAKFTDDEIDKICSGNALRVLRECLK